ncbi:thioredoxin-like protein [Neolentinus lepideus HHB14362 ss-1]|uniref:Thioredoxin-like protein n=1 Tax=Neolentinus lepideus HHB14362 ss-1 TaxID=1314782 RepID=A0A165VHN2_9AGAM|nr:thioredoxin-like protein [Neolentinus lepideus HHB14362 ss-1]
MAATKVIKLVVISDVICPWCYIGQKELLAAIDQMASIPNLCPVKFDVEFRPFRLLTSLKDNDPPVDKETWYAQRFGKDKYENIQKMVGVRAKKVGVNISWGGLLSQSTLAHRLLQKAWKDGGQKLQQPLLTAIFKAFLEDEKDIGDKEVLAECAAEAGSFTKEEAIKFLETDEGLAEVDSMIADTRAKGITGVPFTIIDGKWAVSGGQTADVYVQIFTKLASLEIPTPTGTPAPSK